MLFTAEMESNTQQSVEVLEAPRSFRLEVESLLDRFLLGASVFCLYLLVVAALFQSISVMGGMITLVPAVGLGLLYKYGESAYVVDLSERRLYYTRSLVGMCSCRDICPLDEVVLVAVGGCYVNSLFGSSYDCGWWEYRAFLVLASGEMLPVLDGARENLSHANIFGEDLARRLSVPFEKGDEHCRLCVTLDAFRGVLDVWQDSSDLVFPGLRL